MTSSGSRIQNLITQYFNQLTYGCHNTQCTNSNCASSSTFAHRGITPNEAAVIAIQLTTDGASLCRSLDANNMESLQNSNSNNTNISNSSNSTDPSTTNAPPISSNEEESVEVQNDQTEATSTTSTTGSTQRFLSTPDVARLIMFLYNEADNDDLGSGGGTSHLNNSSALRNVLFGTPDLSSTTPSTDLTLKSLRNSSDLTSSSIPPLSSTMLNQESRKKGLSLTELQQVMDDDRKNGDSSLLIGLISTVFSSYEALSRSFLIQPVDNDDDVMMTMATTISNAAADAADATSSSFFAESKKVRHDLEKCEAGQSDLSADIPMSTSYLDDLSSDLVSHSRSSPVDDEANAKPKSWPTVNLAQVRQAWSLIVGRSADRQHVVDALVRAVRRLVVIHLHHFLVVRPQDGLHDSESSHCQQQQQEEQDSSVDTIGVVQQKLVNLFVILYECPFATDPLHFELLLLNINRAVTWLPLSVQIRLCQTWANAVHMATSCATSSSQSLESTDHTHLNALHKILIHHITLRCLTTDQGSLNEDKQIADAAIVLRIVYFASLLAGQMDKPEILEREAHANRDFETEMSVYRARFLNRRSKYFPPEDPFAKGLNISPNDCRKPFIPVKEFINETLNDGLQLKDDYLYYHSKGIYNEMSFMKLPFLLQTSSKSILFYCDNRTRMFDERHEVLMHALFADIQEMPFFKLRVSRERIVEDALLTLEIASMENPGDFKKQLLIEFENEQGIDEGGLSKEFFQLIIERIFNPDYGMFVLEEETQTYWLNPVPIDDMDREYCLIGTLLGLAIYNNVILDVRFPSVIYRKLVGKLGTFEDLFDAKPSLARGLQSLLNYDGDDFDDAFGCTFSINYTDLFGDLVTSDLKPNGRSIAVTKANRREYVDLYADFLLNQSVAKQFNAFRRGFHMVVDESPLTFLFRPDEIEILIRGCPEYDFKKLEQVTTYEEYTADSPVIKYFWTVVHAMDEQQQKQLLQFTTGSDRVPLGGMAKMKFTIARQGADTQRLPTAHTCFNILLLPDYESLEQLQKLLLLSIAHCKGFGMS